jgi:hypothetical protein
LFEKIPISQGLFDLHPDPIEADPHIQLQMFDL